MKVYFFASSNYPFEEETMQLKWEPSKKDADKARVLIKGIDFANLSNNLKNIE